MGARLRSHTPKPCHTLPITTPNGLLNNMTHLPKYLAVLASLLATQASYAHTSADLADAQARYKREVAECAAEKYGADTRSCLIGARNALADFKRGRLDESTSQSELMRNALLRCDAHKGDDRSDCIARIQGRGRTVGSVAGGGILRELTTTKTLAVNPVMAQPPRPVVPEGPPPSGLMSNCRWVPPSDWVCK